MRRSAACLVVPQRTMLVKTTTLAYHPRRLPLIPTATPAAAVVIPTAVRTFFTASTQASLFGTDNSFSFFVSPLRVSSRCASSTTTTTTTTTTSHTRRLAYHSLLRHLIPLRLQGSSQPPSVLLRHALLHREDLFLPSILTSLASAPPTFPTTQRVLLAEAFQLVLEGDRPQREIREAFEKAELACRRALLDLDEIDTSFFSLPLPPPPRPPATAAQRTQEEEEVAVAAFHAARKRYQKQVRQQVAAERRAWLDIRVSPLHRLWMFELRAAATYYARLFSIPTTSHTTSFDVAALAVHTIVAADVRRDALLTELVLRWEREAVQERASEEEDVLRRRREAAWSPLWSPRYWQWRWVQWRGGHQRHGGGRDKNVGAAGGEEGSAPSRAAQPFCFPPGGEYFGFMHRLKTGQLLQMEARNNKDGDSKGSSSPSPREMPPLSEEDPRIRPTVDSAETPATPHSPGGNDPCGPDWSIDELVYAYTQDIHHDPPLHQSSGPHKTPVGSSSTPMMGDEAGDCSLSSYRYAEDDLVIRELVLLERDCFGRFRFDPRGDNRHFFHLLQLEHVGKTWASASVVFHPLMRAFGNFLLQYTPMANGRWVQLEVQCAEEDHRLVQHRATGVEGTSQPHFHELPLFEEIQTLAEEENGLGWGGNSAAAAATSSSRISFIARYNDPICYLRLSATEKERKEARHHKEKFDLAIETPREDEEVKVFSLDRWFRKRV